MQSKAINLNATEQELYNELIDKMSFLENSNAILTNAQRSLILQGVKQDFNNFINAVMNELKSQSHAKAKGFKIHKSDLSEWEQDYILKKYCFVKYYGQSLPQWFIELY